MNTQICAFLTSTVSFPVVYKELKQEFLKSNQFKMLSGSSCRSINWPRSPGVYIISWKFDNEILYIGMTEKFNNRGDMNNASLATRIARWTPYSFSHDDRYLSFYPIYKPGEDKTKPPSSGYKNQIPIKDLEIGCFLLSQGQKVAPAFIETILLQAHLQDFGKLPPINSSF